MWTSLRDTFMNGIIFSNTKEIRVDTSKKKKDGFQKYWPELEKPEEKWKYLIIPFIWNARKGEIYLYW
jgi:hypothetical protein